MFREAKVHDRAVALMAPGKVDLNPSITVTFGFADPIAAFERLAEGRAADVKTQILM